MRSALMAALLALMLAWSIPSLSASAAVGDALGGTRGPWRQFQDNWTRLFSSLRSYGSGVSDPYQDTLVLGGPRNVGNTPIMDVFVGGRLPYVYWQAIAYDTYENGRWSTQFIEDPQLHFPDDGDLKIPLSASREVITQTVVNYLPNSSFLYAAPQIISTDRQIVIEAATDPTGRLLISSVRSRFVLRQGDQYEVESRFSLADAEGLRSSPTDYPEWVQQYYLPIPDAITPETIQLAADITNGYDNPFDKAIAVRDYLRANITYNDQIPAPPEGVDPVHYTLFISKEGYCNYYASAMAMMLRSQGVPARVVSGYAQGEYDNKTHSYRVRASNAHTWVEVYFQRYGWIQFEPTASIPVYNRPETAETGGDNFASGGVFGGPDRNDFLPEENFEDFDPSALDGDLTNNLPENQTPLFASLPSWQVIGAVMLVVLAGLALLATTQINKRVEGDVDRSYGRLGNWGRWLGLTLQPAHTPYERADMITAVIPEGSTPVRNLTQQFVRKQFSPTHDMDESFDPRSEWRVLRPLLLRQSVINWWQSWRRPKRNKDTFDRWR
jgi:transglutaminase-like putative cysteine protease